MNEDEFWDDEFEDVAITDPMDEEELVEDENEKVPASGKRQLLPIELL